ncbi:MAG TPA: carbon-nitrogen hydrolase family protein [Fimbriimonas sp.]|nr:carbon-nitrogen hydrolase family protein [Fimbriimonas sp.]
MKIACVQTNVAFRDPLANAARAVETIHHLRDQGVDLVVFPEAYLTGYCVERVEDAQSLAIPASHEALSQLQEACDESGALCVVGYAESTGDVLRNTVALMEPNTPPRTYSKTHLPHLGYDMFVERGDHLTVFETRLGRIGLIICYDLRPPEAARVLALKGAELIILPTNWPVGAEISAETISVARAVENLVFLATCNRVGEENGFTFIGKSKIIAPNGKVLASAEAGEEIITAEIDLSQARNKRIVNVPGKYEMDIFGSRNPALYQEIVESAR